MTARQGYVPRSIRQSHIVTWLWVRTAPDSWLGYQLGRWLARRLP